MAFYDPATAVKLQKLQETLKTKKKQDVTNMNKQATEPADWRDTPFVPPASYAPAPEPAKADLFKTLTQGLSDAGGWVADSAKRFSPVADIRRLAQGQAPELGGSTLMQKLLPYLLLGGAGAGGLHALLGGRGREEQKEEMGKAAYCYGFCKQAEANGLRESEAIELFKSAEPMGMPPGSPTGEMLPPGGEGAEHAQEENMSEEDEARLIELLLAELQKGQGLPPGAPAPAAGGEIDPQELMALLQQFSSGHAGGAGGPAPGGPEAGVPPMPQGMA